MMIPVAGDILLHAHMKIMFVLFVIWMQGKLLPWFQNVKDNEKQLMHVALKIKFCMAIEIITPRIWQSLEFPLNECSESDFGG